MSSPFSCAILRTSGEDLWRIRSSIDSTRAPADSAATAGAGRAEGAGDGVTGGGAGVGAAGGGGAGGAGAAAAGAGAGAGGAGGGGAAAAAGGAGASAGFAAAGGVAVASPASPRTPTTVLIGTVCPSATRISVRVPATGAGISASTLSVEISKMGSSRLTLSPTFFSHLVIVPSAI